MRLKLWASTISLSWRGHEERWRIVLLCEGLTINCFLRIIVKESSMKKIILTVVIVFMLSGGASSQFKSQVENQPSVSQSLVHPNTSINSFLGILNPENFMMRHSFSLSYLSAGGAGLSLASYTNSML